MPEHYGLDEQYTEGVYYDLEAGDFCRIIDMKDANTIGLVEPDGDDDTPYYTFSEEGYSYEDAVDCIETDFIKVPDAAVDDPVSFFIEYLGFVLEDGEFDAGFEYADRHTKVVERE